VHELRTKEKTHLKHINAYALAHINNIVPCWIPDPSQMPNNCAWAQLHLH